MGMISEPLCQLWLPEKMKMKKKKKLTGYEERTEDKIIAKDAD